MSRYETLEQEIKRLLSDIVLISKPEQRASKRDNIVVLLERLIQEVKSEEEERAKKIIDEEKRVMKQEVRKSEARQTILDAVSTAVTDHLKSLELESILRQILAKSLLEKNIDDRINARLEELINTIKSREKRDFLPSSNEFSGMYKCLPEGVREKMPICLVVHKCHELVSRPIPVSASPRELEEMRIDIWEALSELQRWKVDALVQIGELEGVMTLQARKIDEELFKAGFPRLLRRMSDGQEMIHYYIPVEPSFMNEAKKVEEGLMEKIREINFRLGKPIIEVSREILRRVAEEERERRIREYREAELI